MCHHGSTIWILIEISSPQTSTVRPGSSIAPMPQSKQLLLPIDTIRRISLQQRLWLAAWWLKVDFCWWKIDRKTPVWMSLPCKNLVSFELLCRFVCPLGQEFLVNPTFANTPTFLAPPKWYLAKAAGCGSSHTCSRSSTPATRSQLPEPRGPLVQN